MAEQNNISNLLKWVGLTSALKQAYEPQHEDEEKLVITVGFKDGDEIRSQLVTVKKCETAGHEVWVHIISRVGEIPPKRIFSALEAVDDNIAGGLVKINDDIYVRHTVPIEHLEADELLRMMDSILMIADELEKEFVGGDEN
jgi:hypothetical protein